MMLEVLSACIAERETEEAGKRAMRSNRAISRMPLSATTNDKNFLFLQVFADSAAAPTLRCTAQEIDKSLFLITNFHFPLTMGRKVRYHIKENI